MKSTRKELSDATLMLEKEYHLGEIAIENHTLSKKNIPPPVKMTKIHQKVQMAKNHFSGAQIGSQSV